MWIEVFSSAKDVQDVNCLGMGDVLQVPVDFLTQNLLQPLTLSARHILADGHCLQAMLHAVT